MPEPGSRLSIPSVCGGDCAPARPAIRLSCSGAALGQLIAKQALASVVDLSELGSNAARRQFMTAFAEAIYDAAIMYFSEQLLYVVEMMDLSGINLQNVALAASSI
jgi:hypothetical protein